MKKSIKIKMTKDQHKKYHNEQKSIITKSMKRELRRQKNKRISLKFWKTYLDKLRID